MKVIVCVVVYNRYENIKHWLKCWKLCEQHGAELRVIHNYYGDLLELDKFKTLCEDVIYVPRNGLGFDIGAFQDVCRGRLPGFDNDWDKMLWCTDDVLPMRLDFLSAYIESDAEVPCMQISPEVAMHIRTTGFMIRKETASTLIFPADPIVTKEDCYRFEHRGLNHFYKQVKAKMVAPVGSSLLWDTGYSKRLNRHNEHNMVFNKPEGKVTFICPIFDAYPQIISSLICQTYTNWELVLIHDGENNLTKYITDKRITYIHRDRAANYGHPHRKWCLEQEQLLADFVVITNADNYYAPVFTEKLIAGFNHDTVATYCESMVHNYMAWGVIPCRLQRGYIDCGGVMVRKEVAQEIGWPNEKEHSADWIYFENIIKKYGAIRWNKVPGCLFMHN